MDIFTEYFVPENVHFRTCIHGLDDVRLRFDTSGLVVSTSLVGRVSCA
jgi:hypothetical protein